MRGAWGVRSNERGNAGFAIVAVTLLFLGGAAALYLRGVDEAASALQEAHDGEQARLEGAASIELLTLTALAKSALSDVIGDRFVPAPGAMARVSSAAGQSLADRLEALYPRRASGDVTVDVELLFARATGIEAEAELPSPYGGRAAVPVPAFAGIEGVVRVNASGSSENLSATLGFAAHLPAPILLPAAMAARVAAESSPGGRVERDLGERAAESLRTSPSAILDPSWARDLVDGAFEAEAVANVAVSGPLGSTIVSTVDTSNLTVAPTWTFFDGGEVNDAIWASLRIDVHGSLVVLVNLSAQENRAAVGPIEIPVAFTARAFGAGLPERAVVPDGVLKDALEEVREKGLGSRYGAAFAVAGFAGGTNGSVEVNNSTTAVVLHILAREARAALPPLEDYHAFVMAAAPPEGATSPGTIALDFGEPITAERALLRVDGLDVGYYPTTNGSLQVPGLWPGIHAISLTVESNGTRYAGAAEVAVGRAPWTVTVPMAPRFDSEFFKAALARGEALPERAGITVLAAAGERVGLPRPSNASSLEEAASYASEALRRLAALEVAGLADKAARAQRRDAADFLGIMLGLFKGADAANRELQRGAVPAFGWVGSVATVAISPSPASVLKVTIQSLKVAEAVAKGGSIQLTVHLGGADTVTRDLPSGKFLLALNAVASALSLAADVVKIEGAFGNNSTADAFERSLTVANFGVHIAQMTLAVAEAVYRIASAALYRALEGTFLTIGAAVTAAILIVEVASLYHETGGNLSLMWKTLILPDDVGGITRLPALVGGAFAVVGDILYLTGMISSKGGPIGVAASLFVLAGLLVINKEAVASAIFGTLDYGTLRKLEGNMSEAVATGFAGAAAANALDLPRAGQARRAASAAAAAGWLTSALTPDGEAADAAARRSEAARARSAVLGGLLDASLRLRFAARAFVEQADDFASPPYDVAPGRHTEGYRAFHTLTGSFNFSGDVVVNFTMPGGANATLGRDTWRGILENVGADGLGPYTFAWTISDTNGIKVDEFTRWADRLEAAGAEFTRCAAEYRIAALALA